MELARGLSLKATGWVLAGSQRSLQGGPDSTLLSGQRVQGPLTVWGQEREKGLETEQGGGMFPKADSGKLGRGGSTPWSLGFAVCG